MRRSFTLSVIFCLWAMPAYSQDEGISAMTPNDLVLKLLESDSEEELDRRKRTVHAWIGGWRDAFIAVYLFEEVLVDDDSFQEVSDCVYAKGVQETRQMIVEEATYARAHKDTPISNYLYMYYRNLCGNGHLGKDPEWMESKSTLGKLLMPGSAGRVKEEEEGPAVAR